ncbi:YciI family protein [Thalassospira lucentensis]|uniref:YciI family protein n=1 Tax=Thalassospira lucentensis TaxID=168935 RepID=UPI003AA81E00
MFTVFLRFAEHRARAPEFMDGHKAWIKQGFDDGVFLMVGSLQPNMGGAILAHAIARDALEARVKNDPFVVEGIVTAEILEITPVRADERLNFLMG